MGFSSKPIVVDAKGHLLGRLACAVAKQLLLGQKVVVVRCEQLNISGGFYRNKLKFLDYLRKRCNVNPSRGPFHFRAPSRMLRHAIKGMLPHKVKRGIEALKRYKGFEGIPPTYSKVKRMVAPAAMRVMCLKPRRKYTDVGRLASEVGWKNKAIIEKLEAKRKVHTLPMHEKRKREGKVMQEARKNVAKKVEKYQKIIESLGYH